MTADFATTLQQLLWAGPAFLAFLADTRPVKSAGAEPVLLFRSEGFAEDLIETHPCTRPQLKAGNRP